MLNLPHAEHRDVESLQNWLDGNRYLAEHKELDFLAPVTDRGEGNSKLGLKLC
jgi:hypothetical protein